MALTVGSRLGHYAVTAKIGEGEMKSPCPKVHFPGGPKMKSRIFTFAVVAALTPIAASAQIQFEGTVSGTMEADGTKVEMVQRMQGSMMRLDMNLPDKGGSVGSVSVLPIEPQGMVCPWHQRRPPHPVTDRRRSDTQ